MDDLFTYSRQASPEDSAVQDYEYRLWAERVIREVSEEVSRDERKSKEFVRAWIRWTDLVSFVNYIELSMFRRKAEEQEIAKTELRWHETLVAGLVSLGGLLAEWAKGFDQATLELIGFELEGMETMLESMRESLDLWHSEECVERTQAIGSLLDA